MTPRETAENIVRKFVERRAAISKAPACADEVTSLAILGSAIELAIIAAVEDERESCASMLEGAEVEPYCGFQIAELARQIRARCTSSASACNTSATQIPYKK